MTPIASSVAITLLPGFQQQGHITNVPPAALLRAGCLHPILAGLR